MIPSNNIKTTGDPWASYKRYKVNEVVMHNGVSYQNTTGINTEPISGSVNWYSPDFITDSDLPFIIVNNNLFRLIKNPVNNNPVNKKTVELNDFIDNGYYDDSVLIIRAKYNTGDINDFGTLANNFTDGSYTQVKYVE